MTKVLSTQPNTWDCLFPWITRLLVWGLLLGVVYMLRSFFLLVFLTFIFSYILASGTERLRIYIKNRTIRVVLITGLFLTVLIALSLFIAPRIAKQADTFVNQFATYVHHVDQGLFKLSQKYVLLKEIIPELKEENGLTGSDWSLKRSPTIQLIGLGEKTTGKLDVEQILASIANLGRHVVSISAAFILALVFSFLIVLDLPQLSASIVELKNTRLRFIYSEVADSLYDFGKILGKTFEAQFIIAIVNTLLTAIGIYLLGLGEHVAFLSAIVFLSSFIPVIGIFISSIPICLIALQDTGFNTMLLAVALIAMIHLFEGYVLNPRIYGARLRINPVIVLIILTIGGNLFHFWGLILGVPVCSYIFDHAIRIKR